MPITCCCCICMGPTDCCVGFCCCCCCCGVAALVEGVVDSTAFINSCWMASMAVCSSSPLLPLLLLPALLLLPLLPIPSKLSNSLRLMLGEVNTCKQRQKVKVRVSGLWSAYNDSCDSRPTEMTCCKEI